MTTALLCLLVRLIFPRTSRRYTPNRWPYLPLASRPWFPYRCSGKGFVSGQTNGLLDYVTAWYFKAADFIKDTPVQVGFVSTNSITQGEQVGVLWNALFAQGMKIIVAHRTFPWQSEARGKAHVHVVIIGFGVYDVPVKKLYDYADGDTPTVAEVRGISPYLVEGGQTALPSRTSTPNGMPKMKKGSQPTDGGHLILTGKDRAELLEREPGAEKWLRPFIGGEELLNGRQRWCLWLKGVSPAELKALPLVLERVAKVRESRLKSPTTSVRQCADSPTLFTQDRQPDADYLAVPEVSSETWRFIPIAFLPATIIGSNKLQMIVGGTRFHFGVLSSTMHMAWVRVVSGRLESRYSYAPAVYNNFPWPSEVDDKQKAAVESAAQAVLDVRARYTASTLADLYDPLTMPPDLVKAHADLDRAVDRCYRAAPFTSDRQRVEFLFALYETITAPLLPAEKKGRRRK